MIETQTSSVEKKGKARENYSHKKMDVRIQKRRDEAIDRQAKYNTLTIDEKIRLAHSRRGNNKRELERLTKTKELSTPAPGIIETKTEKKKGKKVL